MSWIWCNVFADKASYIKEWTHFCSAHRVSRRHGYKYQGQGGMHEERVELGVRTKIGRTQTNKLLMQATIQFDAKFHGRKSLTEIS